MGVLVGASVFPRRDDTAGDFGELHARVTYARFLGEGGERAKRVVGCR